MSNPDSSTPSIQALDKAVKPAGYTCWDAFQHDYNCTAPHLLALAYAADLDKADKVGRMVRDYFGNPSMDNEPALYAEAKSLILPEPIDPDLLEAREMFAEYHKQGGCDLMLNSGFIGKEGAANDLIMAGEFDHNPFVKMALKAIKRGRELAKEQDRG